jgi:ribosomal protein S20
MKITQSQLKSLVRTIVKESVSELTKGKRRRSLRENAGKKVAEIKHDPREGEIISVDGKDYLVDDLVKLVHPEYDGDFGASLEMTDSVQKVIKTFLRNKGVTHVNSYEHSWEEEPIENVY